MLLRRGAGAVSTREDLRRFYALDIRHDALGLGPWGSQEGCFCTPEGAEIFGGPGVDGIHYVLLPGDERVFCVDPGAEEGTFVLPVGEDFREFLSFLLFCRDESPLAQLRRLDEAGFRGLLEENAKNTWPGCEAFFKERDAALETVGEAFGLEPRDPYAGVKALQGAFDPARLTFSDEYYDILGLENPRGVAAAPEARTQFAEARIEIREETP